MLYDPVEIESCRKLACRHCNNEKLPSCKTDSLVISSATDGNLTKVGCAPYNVKDVITASLRNGDNGRGRKSPPSKAAGLWSMIYRSFAKTATKPLSFLTDTTKKSTTKERKSWFSTTGSSTRQIRRSPDILESSLTICILLSNSKTNTNTTEDAATRASQGSRFRML